MANERSAPPLPLPVRWYGKAADVLEAIQVNLAALCLAVFIGLIFVDVFYRQAIGRPLLFNQELAVTLFIWSVMLGSAVAARRQVHFVIDFLPPTLSDRVERALALAVAALVLVLAYVMVSEGLVMADRGWRRRSPMTGYPLFWTYISIPIAGASFAIYAIEHILRILCGHDPRPHYSVDPATERTP